MRKRRLGRLERSRHPDDGLLTHIEVRIPPPGAECGPAYDAWRAAWAAHDANVDPHGLIVDCSPIIATPRGMHAAASAKLPTPGAESADNSKE